MGVEDFNTSSGEQNYPDKTTVWMPRKVHDVAAAKAKEQGVPAYVIYAKALDMYLEPDDNLAEFKQMVWTGNQMSLEDNL